MSKGRGAKSTMRTGTSPIPVTLKDFHQAVRRYRNHQYRRSIIKANRAKAENVLRRLDELYGLTEYFDLPMFYPTLISTTTFSYHYRHKKDGGFKKWSYFPSGSDWLQIRNNAAYRHNDDIEAAYRKRVQLRLDRIARSFAGKDPYFAIGYSRARDIQSRSFQFEVDFEEKVNEDNLYRYLHEDLLAKVSKYLTPHIILSGNRSVYIAFFVNEPISNTAWMKLYRKIRRFLLHSGKNDVHTFFGAGIRLPLSRHQKTHELCRFMGCENEESVVDYLFGITPDSIDEVRLLAIADALSGLDGRTVEYRGNSIPQSLDHLEVGVLKRRLNRKDLSLHEMWDHLHLLDIDEDTWGEQQQKNEKIFGPLMDAGASPDEEDRYASETFSSSIKTTYSTTPTTIFTVGDTKSESIYCQRSPNRVLYELMIEDGIPYGSSTEILLLSDFVRYCLNRFSVEDKDGEKRLREIVVKGIAEVGRQKDRLRKLDCMLDLIGKDPKIGATSSRRAPLDAEYRDRFPALKALLEEELKCQHRSRNRERHLQALNWVLQKFQSYGTPCHLGVEEMREELRLPDKRIASRLLNYFQYQFPILKLRHGHYYDPKGKSGRKQEFDLLPPGEWPSRIYSQRRRPTKAEQKKAWEKFCS